MNTRSLAVVLVLAVLAGATSAPAVDGADTYYIMLVTGNPAVRSMLLWPPNAPDPGSLPFVFGAAGPLTEFRVRFGIADPWCESLAEPVPGLTVGVLEGRSQVPTLAFGSPAGTLLEPANAQGYARVALPLRGGGYSATPRSWLLTGPIFSCAWNFDDLKVNSPDLNGDLVMNLIDLVLFNQCLFGPYQYRADFNFDQVINLSDLVYFARAYGTYPAP